MIGKASRDVTSARKCFKDDIIQRMTKEIHVTVYLFPKDRVCFVATHGQGVPLQPQVHRCIVVPYIWHILHGWIKNSILGHIITKYSPCCVLRGAQWQSTEWIVLTPSLLCRLYLLCEALFLFITTCSVDSAASRRRDENMYTAVRHYFLSFGFLIYWSNRGAKSLKIVSAGSQCVVFVSSESWTTPRHLFTLLRCQNEKANRSREFCRMR